MVEGIKYNAMKKVHEMYNWDGIANQTFEVYKEVIEESKNNTWENTELKNGMKEINDKKVIHTVENKVKKVSKKSEELKKIG